MKQTKVEISKNAQKEIQKLPKHTTDALLTWIRAIEEDGMNEVRKISGYHDEPLKGDRLGQRSIKLNIAYRAIYIIKSNGELEVVTVIEVNKHKY
jgi:proteic killer suppression protein